jgi:hypothetical protein
MSHDPYVMISMKIPFEMTKVDHKLMRLAWYKLSSLYNICTDWIPIFGKVIGEK